MNEYESDAVSKPTDTLRETLESIGMSEEEFIWHPALSIWSDYRVEDILNGKIPFTAPHVAERLEKVTGVPAQFWINRQTRYDEWKKK